MPQEKLHVELLSYTMEPEVNIAFGAKLCYSKMDIGELKGNIVNNDQEEFINKLRDIGHMSPLEHSSFTFGIEGVSRALLAQLTRHRIASFSVKSQRYVGEVGSIVNKIGDDIFIIGNPEVILEIKPEFLTDNDVFGYVVPDRIIELGEESIKEFKFQMAQMQLWYTYWYYKLGATKEIQEDARFVLPNACETKILMTMNARELLHFFDIRACNRAQWEIRALAKEIIKLVKGVAPIVFKKAGPKCIKLGYCPEGDMSCGT